MKQSFYSQMHENCRYYYYSSNEKINDIFPFSIQANDFSESFKIWHFRAALKAKLATFWPIHEVRRI